MTGSTRIMCCTYDDHAPILAIDDGNVSVSLSVPDVHHVTGEDVNRALALADAVARYAAELGERVADEDRAARVRRREWAGRLELVPPAAPFSPPRGEAKEEVSILCARS